MYFDVFFLELLKMRTLVQSFVFHFKVRFYIENFTTKPKQFTLHCIFEIFKALNSEALKSQQKSNQNKIEQVFFKIFILIIF